MAIGDIECHIKEMYGLDVSDSAISWITDQILTVVKEWHVHSLQDSYTVVYLDN